MLGKFARFSSMIAASVGPIMLKNSWDLSTSQGFILWGLCVFIYICAAIEYGYKRC